jgi:hypothetical protein
VEPCGAWERRRRLLTRAQIMSGIFTSKFHRRIEAAKISHFYKSKIHLKPDAWKHAVMSGGETASATSGAFRTAGPTPRYGSRIVSPGRLT